MCVSLSFVLHVLIAVTLLAGGAKASADSHVYACAYLPTEPASPVVYAFKNGGHHCMYHYKFEQNVTVTSAGITCSSPYVHIKSKGSSTGGDLCATDASTWDFGFNVYDTESGKPTGTTGAVHTNWDHPILSSSKVTISGAPASVCSSAADCEHRSMHWHDTADMYFIFKPFASSEL